MASAFFGQPKRRCDLRVNEYTAYSCRQLLAKAAMAASGAVSLFGASRKNTIDAAWRRNDAK
jgi:hypothetical protein